MNRMGASGPSTARRILLLALPIVAIAIPLAGIAWADQAIRAMGEEPDSTLAFVGAIGVLAVAAAAVGAAILWRQPGNRIGVLMIVGALLLETGVAAYPLAFLRVVTVGPDDTIAGLANWWGVIAVEFGVVALFPAVGIVFPDGRLPSRRWRLPVALAAAILVLGSTLSAIAPWPETEDSLARNPFGIAGLPPELLAVGSTIATLGAFILFALAVIAIVVRFRRSTGAERAQIKWPIAALAVIALTYPISELTDIDALDVLSVSLGALVPISIGIAVMRYRLFEIDRIVSRTIAYGAVTVLLVGAYTVAIVVLQGPLSAVTGGDTIRVAISTLLAAALFQPLRRRVQAVVDRRFDRARVDAERTSSAFGERLREDLDIESLTADLRATVHAALRPTHQGLWLRDGAQGADR